MASRPAVSQSRSTMEDREAMPRMPHIGLSRGRDRDGEPGTQQRQPESYAVPGDRHGPLPPRGNDKARHSHEHLHQKPQVDPKRPQPPHEKQPRNDSHDAGSENHPHQSLPLAMNEKVVLAMPPRNEDDIAREQ